MSQEVKEGTLRRLTIGEIALARQVFRNSIAYHKVWIHCDSYLPFGLQQANTAMAPNGELWFRKELYKPDFSMAYIYAQHTFIHEMAHVWQHQKGMWVRSRGLFSWAADYHYTRHTSSRRCVGFPHSPRSLTGVSSRGFVASPPSRDSNYLGYIGLMVRNY